MAPAETTAHGPRNERPEPESHDRLGGGADAVATSPLERRHIEEQSRPSAALIHETIRAEGESELRRTAMALLLSGFAAGLSMGFSLVVSGLLQARLPDAPWR